VPHGISVITSAPSALAFTASARPERHLEAAALVCADASARSAPPEDAGVLLAGVLERMMKDTRVPIGLRALGYGEGDVAALVGGTIVQKRLLDNAPRSVSGTDLLRIFQGAMGAHA
jgi:alcohol dehydrogenase class IV